MAVARGISEHYRKSRDGSEFFALRRRIHMLEKGLSMRPRRSTFAEAYIGDVVDKLRRANEQGMLSNELAAWARDVLSEYFEATRESPSRAIGTARTEFETLTLESPLSGYFGPSAAGTNESPVTLEAMMALAMERRSVRWFKKEPVPRVVIDAALMIAQEAPTACNRVPYRILILDDARQAEAIASIAGGTAGYAHNIPALAVIVGDLSAYEDERDRHLIYIDGSLAAMSFLYGLQAQGVASCCINWPDVKKREKRMAAALQLKAHERVVMLVAFGFAEPEGMVPGSPKLNIDQLRSYVPLKN